METTELVKHTSLTDGIFPSKTHGYPKGMTTEKYQRRHMTLLQLIQYTHCTQYFPLCHWRTKQQQHSRSAKLFVASFLIVILIRFIRFIRFTRPNYRTKSSSLLSHNYCGTWSIFNVTRIYRNKIFGIFVGLVEHIPFLYLHLHIEPFQPFLQ